MHDHMFRQAVNFSRDEEHECIRQSVGRYFCVPVSDPWFPQRWARPQTWCSDFVRFLDT